MAVENVNPLTFIDEVNSGRYWRGVQNIGYDEYYDELRVVYTDESIYGYGRLRADLVNVDDFNWDVDRGSYQNLITKTYVNGEVLAVWWE